MTTSALFILNVLVGSDGFIFYPVCDTVCCSACESLKCTMTLVSMGAILKAPCSLISLIFLLIVSIFVHNVANSKK